MTNYYHCCYCYCYCCCYCCYYCCHCYHGCCYCCCWADLLITTSQVPVACTRHRHRHRRRNLSAVVLVVLLVSVVEAAGLHCVGSMMEEAVLIVYSSLNSMLSSKPPPQATWLSQNPIALGRSHPAASSIVNAFVDDIHAHDGDCSMGGASSVDCGNLVICKSLHPFSPASMLVRSKTKT